MGFLYLIYLFHSGLVYAGFLKIEALYFVLMILKTNNNNKKCPISIYFLSDFPGWVWSLNDTYWIILSKLNMFYLCVVYTDVKL